MSRFPLAVPALAAPLALALLAPAGPGLAAEAALPPAALHYGLTVAGLPIARADLSIDDRGGRYDADVEWRTVGIAGIFAAASGKVAAQGRLVGGRPHPRAYRLIERNGDTPFDVAMALSGGRVGRLVVEPPAKVGEDIVPVEAEHRRGVTDPLSAALIPGSTPASAVCDRTLPIFDGWSRWDVRLAPKTVVETAPTGMRGPTVVCSARWVPIAGHREGHRSVRYMAENRDLEVRLARLPDRDLWLPVEASVGTMIGTARATLETVTTGGR